jgi:hypothetical protein
MRLINTKAHGIVDYLLGIILLSSVHLFHYHDRSAMMAADAAGVIVLLNTLLTAFEPGFLHLIPLRVHFAIDVVTGLLLASSPWLFGFERAVYKPHLVFGLAIAAVGVLSDRVLWSTVKKN